MSVGKAQSSLIPPAQPYLSQVFACILVQPKYVTQRVDSCLFPFQLGLG